MMILTPQMIEHMRRYWRIDEQLERMLLEQFGSSPYPHVYTEQDIYEQRRKMVIQYNNNHDTMLQNRSPSGCGRTTKKMTKPGGNIP